MSKTGAESAVPYILHSAATQNGFKVSIMLEELGAAYETRVVDLAKGEQKGPTYLRSNPNGKIPTLVDPSEDDFVIFESRAILLYSARKTRRFLPASRLAPMLANRMLALFAIRYPIPVTGVRLHGVDTESGKPPSTAGPIPVTDGS